MKPYYLIRAFACCLFSICILQSYALDASLEFGTFKASANSDAYLEVQLHIIGSSMRIDQGTEGFEYAAECTFMISKNDVVVSAEKTLLTSPAFQNKVAPVDVFDLRRYALDDGKYLLNVLIRDTRDTNNIFLASFPIEVDYGKNQAKLSDILLLGKVEDKSTNQTFLRHGKFMESQPFAFYPQKANALIWHAEFYSEQFAEAKALIIKSEIFPEGKEMPVQTIYKKQAISSINVLLYALDISGLPSGNYDLRISLTDPDKQFEFSGKRSFQRSNPNLLVQNKVGESPFLKILNDKTDEQVDEAIERIFPIIFSTDVKFVSNLAKRGSREEKINFLNTFWSTTSSINPMDGYIAYEKQIADAQKLFGTISAPVYETERGIIYLKYGAPTARIERQNESSTPPYEIWEYIETTDGQRNVKFIFYDPTLVGDGFRLLHSTARGELQDPFWEKKLYTRTERGNSIDDTTPTRDFSRNAGKLFGRDN